MWQAGKCGAGARSRRRRALRRGREYEARRHIGAEATGRVREVGEARYRPRRATPSGAAPRRHRRSRHRGRRRPAGSCAARRRGRSGRRDRASGRGRPRRRATTRLQSPFPRPRANGPVTVRLSFWRASLPVRRPRRRRPRGSRAHGSRRRRRPVTWSARLTLAGAASAKTLVHLVGGGLGWRRRDRRRRSGGAGAAPHRARP